MADKAAVPGSLNRTVAESWEVTFDDPHTVSGGALVVLLPKAVCDMGGDADYFFIPYDLLEQLGLKEG